VCSLLFLSLRLPCSTLFPYTTLFRSHIINHISGKGGDVDAIGCSCSNFEGRKRIWRTYGGSKCNALSMHEGDIETRQDSDHIRRSEEHTSELQSRENLVCRLLLEKKK